MKNEPMHGAVKSIRRLVEPRQDDQLSDRELLERFVARNDEAAFAQLVRRHGPMVLGVCRRVLRNRHDAEDAFQAAFMILARKGYSLRDQGSVGSWLFQTAYHLALNMKAKADRKRTCVLRDTAQPDTESGRPDLELCSILDEELARLPEKYRVVLLICHCEGTTRAEAARKLGWKEGTVKIRLERGRALLRDRLARRGIALSGILVGSLLAQNAAAVPSCLLRDTTASALTFAMGNLPAGLMSKSAVVLAQGVLKTMFVNRLKIAVLLVLSAGIAFFGAGLGAYQAFAKTPKADGLTQSQVGQEPQSEPRPRKKVTPPPDEKQKKPLRVLLFADGPTREYQFVRSYFVNQMEKKEMELCIHLQKSGAQAVQDVPPDRMLLKFPTRLSDKEKKEDADDKYGNLARYDVIIAFDPDWMELSVEQKRLLEQWVAKQGGALIFVAGPVHTMELVRPGIAARERKPINDLLPVQLEDLRTAQDRETDKPWALKFTTPEKFLQLDDRGNDSLGGWSEFFFGTKRNDWQLTEDRPLRGFYSAYPVKSVKPTAKVIAGFRDPKARMAGDAAMPQDLPYLVTMPHGKGKTIYLGSGETWRLRQFNTAFHERLWSALVRYAASADPARPRKSDTRSPDNSPEQRNAVDKD